MELMNTRNGPEKDFQQNRSGKRPREDLMDGSGPVAGTMRMKKNLFCAAARGAAIVAGAGARIVTGTSLGTGTAT